MPNAIPPAGGAPRCSASGAASRSSRRSTGGQSRSPTPSDGGRDQQRRARAAIPDAPPRAHGAPSCRRPPRRCRSPAPAAPRPSRWRPTVRSPRVAPSAPCRPRPTPCPGGTCRGSTRSRSGPRVHPSSRCPQPASMRAPGDDQDRVHGQTTTALSSSQPGRDLPIERLRSELLPVAHQRSAREPTMASATVHCPARSTQRLAYAPSASAIPALAYLRDMVGRETSAPGFADQPRQRAGRSGSCRRSSAASLMASGEGSVSRPAPDLRDDVEHPAPVPAGHHRHPDHQRFGRRETESLALGREEHQSAWAR